MEKIIGQVVCIEDRKIENGVLVNKKIRVTIEVDTDFETTKNFLTSATLHPNRFKMHTIEIRNIE